MRSSCIVWLTAAVGCSALLSGCGGKDSTGPITPKTVAVASGNGQTGPGGDDLPDSLRVVVTGSNDQPMVGVTVSWAAGGATISPLTSTTDANGQTAARLSLGAVGSVIATATVAGLTPATFNATAADPCGWLHALSLGQTATGQLRQYDCQLSDNSFIDFYELPVSGQQALGIRLTSASFNAFIWFFDLAGLVGVNNDTTTSANTNSFFKLVAAPGDYIIGANSLFGNEMGPYTLRAATTNQSEENCEEVWLTRGVTTAQVLSTTDCAAAGPSYSDAFWVVLYSGDSLDVKASTLAFDAQLQLDTLNTAGSLAPVASDDSVGGTHLTYTATVSNFYLLEASAMTVGGHGAYTLTLAAPAASAAVATRPRILASPRLFSKLSRRSLKR